MTKLPSFRVHKKASISTSFLFLLSSAAFYQSFQDISQRLVIPSAMSGSSRAV